jgi:hypothetical protein
LFLQTIKEQTISLTEELSETLGQLEAAPRSDLVELKDLIDLDDKCRSSSVYIPDTEILTKELEKIRECEV